MTDFLINPYKTCAFTGHRNLEKDFDIKRVEEKLRWLIERGFDTFLVGMAVGFDSECFRVLEKLRLEFSIKIVACIPCPNQDIKFSAEQSKEYLRMVNSADKKIVLSQRYTPYCMMKRNKFMVDNSSVLIAYLKHNKGGTFNTVNYAKTVNIPIIYI